MNMDPHDGSGGANANVVTQSDIDAAYLCPADYDAIDMHPFEEVVRVLTAEPSGSEILSPQS